MNLWGVAAVVKEKANEKVKEEDIMSSIRILYRKCHRYDHTERLALWL
jgi:hypothetical protein